MMNKLIITQIFKHYKTSEVIKSFLTALLFFLLLGSIFITPMVQIIYLYVPYVEFFLIGIYIYVSLISIYFNKRVVDTLKTYNVIDTINYDKFKVRSTTVMTIIAFITVLIFYIYLH